MEQPCSGPDSNPTAMQPTPSGAHALPCSSPGLPATGLLVASAVPCSSHAAPCSLDLPVASMLTASAVPYTPTDLPAATPLALLDLPPTALALVAQNSNRMLGGGHPLLGVSRAARDVVLSCLSQLRLAMSPQESATSVEVLVRLMDRACSLAPPGLTLTLNAQRVEHSTLKPGQQPPDEEERLLWALLQPASTGGGWVNVHALNLQCWQGYTGPLRPGLSARLVVAFPSLRTLRLSLCHIRGEALFTSLLSCQHLHSLTLDDRISLDAAAASALCVLSGLTSLKALDINTRPVRSQPSRLPGCAALTQLTRLALGEGDAPFREVAAALSGGRRQLRELTYSCEEDDIFVLLFPQPTGTVPSDIDAGHLEQLLTCLPQLTGLDFGHGLLDENAVEVLMQHAGSRLARLSVGSISTTIRTAPATGSRFTVDAGALTRLFASCSNLTDLGVSQMDVDQAGLNALLAHTPLTALVLGSIDLESQYCWDCDQGRIQMLDAKVVPCSWRKLMVMKPHDLTILPLLPVPSHTFSFDGHLRLAVGEEAMSSLPHLVHGVACHLGRCREVGSVPDDLGKSTPRIIQLTAPDLPQEEAYRDDYGMVKEFTPELRMELLAALAPMAAHCVRMEISIGTPGWVMGRAEVEALGHAVGGTLEHLTLRCGEVQNDFWPALLASSSPLPLLTVLELGNDVHRAVQGVHLVLACMHAQRRLTLRLDHQYHRDVEAGEWEDLMEMWGHPDPMLVQVECWDGQSRHGY